jgi:DNA-binding MarR family transcriptional regulator
MAEPDVAHIAADLRLVIGQLVRRLRSEPSALALGQINVLGFLARDGAATVSDLAGATHVRPQSMARTVADLADGGLVAGRPHPSDGRKTLIDLTPAGRAAIEEERERRAGWLAEAIARELTPAEQRTLGEATALLARLTAREPAVSGRSTPRGGR